MHKNALFCNDGVMDTKMFICGLSLHKSKLALRAPSFLKLLWFACRYARTCVCVCLSVCLCVCLCIRSQGH